MEIIPEWMANLDDEDVTFIKNFLLVSGSLKEAAAIAKSAGMHDVRIIEDLTGRQRFLFAHTG